MLARYPDSLIPIVLLRQEGRLVEDRSELMPGQSYTAGVRAHDGSFHTDRVDYVLPGFGPQVAIGRTYDNVSDRELALGPGWVANTHDVARPLLWELPEPVADGEETTPSVPSWITESQQAADPFHSPSNLRPPDGERWHAVEVRDNTFIYTGGEWVNQRGRYGRLEETTVAPEGSGIDCSDVCLRFTATDGVEFYYEYPGRHPSAASPPDTDLRGNIPLRYTLPIPEPVQLVQDTMGNAVRYIYYEGDDQASAAPGCFSDAFEGQLCRVESDSTMACEFRYQRISGPAITNPVRLNTVTCGEWSGGFSGETRDVAYSFDTAGYLRSATYDDTTETYTYTSENPSDPQSRRNLVRIDGPAGSEQWVCYSPQSPDPVEQPTYASGTDIAAATTAMSEEDGRAAVDDGFVFSDAVGRRCREPEPAGQRHVGVSMCPRARRQAPSMGDAVRCRLAHGPAFGRHRHPDAAE